MLLIHVDLSFLRMKAMFNAYACKTCLGHLLKHCDAFALYIFLLSKITLIMLRIMYNFVGEKNEFAITMFISN